MISLALSFVLAPQEPKMAIHIIAVLKTGTNQVPLAPDQGAKMQREHLGNLKWLVDRKKALAVGPLDGAGDWRGLIVFQPDITEEVAKASLADDPFVKGGYLQIEVLKWYSQVDVFKPRTAGFLDLEAVTFGLLVRPKDAPTYPEAELAEIQKGHMANIIRMADAGWLAAAGPLASTSDLRGIFVFRGTDQKQIREEVAKDAAIQKGRLECRLSTWYVSKGVVPPAK
ncbi:MAG TPA: hypothetical protein PKA27_05460 [Fimbriimonadaceae bacterium]|nr:hypothetical protein [Fimbriimonadaceae bacterium]